MWASLKMPKRCHNALVCKFQEKKNSMEDNCDNPRELKLSNPEPWDIYNTLPQFSPRNIPFLLHFSSKSHPRCWHTHSTTYIVSAPPGPMHYLAWLFISLQAHFLHRYQFRKADIEIVTLQGFSFWKLNPAVSNWNTSQEEELVIWRSVQTKCH